ncbi:MAG: hypothetical protein RR458_03285 [Clostridia bacterium]
MNLGEKKYTKAQVQELLRGEQFKYETSLSEQKERIFALVEENKLLKKEIANFKSKDEQVGKALVSAVERAKEIEDTAKKKFQGGLNRLKIFESKFANYYKMIIAQYPVDQNLAKVEDFLKSLDEVLMVDNMSTTNSKKMFNSKNNLGVSSNLDASTSEFGFDFNEALNPSKDLEDICRELGLMQ